MNKYLEKIKEAFKNSSLSKTKISGREKALLYIICVAMISLLPFIMLTMPKISLAFAASEYYSALKERVDDIENFENENHEIIDAYKKALLLQKQVEEKIPNANKTYVNQKIVTDIASNLGIEINSLHIGGYSDVVVEGIDLAALGLINSGITVAPVRVTIEDTLINIDRTVKAYENSALNVKVSDFSISQMSYEDKLTFSFDMNFYASELPQKGE